MRIADSAVISGAPFRLSTPYAAAEELSETELPADAFSPLSAALADSVSDSTDSVSVSPSAALSPWVSASAAASS